MNALPNKFVILTFVPLTSISLLPTPDANGEIFAGLTILSSLSKIEQISLLPNA